MQCSVLIKAILLKSINRNCQLGIEFVSWVKGGVVINARLSQTQRGNQHIG